LNATTQGPPVIRTGCELTGTKSAQKLSGAGQTIWIDLDNTPHVPFFRPIKQELESLGFRVVLSARDAFQVCELATKTGLSYKRIGRHYGKSRIRKVMGLGWRTLQLLPFVLKEKPYLALSHGARSQIMISNLLRIPSVMVMDYEHAQTQWLMRPKWEIVPKVLLSEDLHCTDKQRIRTYEGIKEDVYAPSFKPDPEILPELGLSGQELIVTVRPPANEAHYHNPESESFFEAFMSRLCSTPGAKAVLLPRNKSQESQLRLQWPAWFADSKVIVPKTAVDGLNLVWHSDLVVSGGGTMNREAAALGVPVYSIFRGKIGAVDRQLQRDGRLALIERIEDVENKIALKRRNRAARPDKSPQSALGQIVQHIVEIMQIEKR
jgi:predicted glycosyltransferase